jgi:hypothetical protein
MIIWWRVATREGLEKWLPFFFCHFFMFIEKFAYPYAIPLLWLFIGRSCPARTICKTTSSIVLLDSTLATVKNLEDL